VGTSLPKIRTGPFPVPLQFAGIDKPRSQLSNLKCLYQQTRFVTIMLIQSACVQRSAKVASGSRRTAGKIDRRANLASLLALKAPGPQRQGHPPSRSASAGRRSIGCWRCAGRASNKSAHEASWYAPRSRPSRLWLASLSTCLRPPLPPRSVPIAPRGQRCGWLWPHICQRWRAESRLGLRPRFRWES
jgi:hypothetical protein